MNLVGQQQQFLKEAFMDLVKDKKDNRHFASPSTQKACAESPPQKSPPLPLKNAPPETRTGFRSPGWLNLNPSFT